MNSEVIIALTIGGVLIINVVVLMVLNLRVGGRH
jgi:hypothetical protein